jgi:hypothetical protein
MIFETPGSLVENADGTAQITGRVVDADHPSKGFDVTVNLDGRTYDEPSGSPKTGGNANLDTSSWYYYTEASGVLNGVGPWAGAVIEFEGVGPAWQVGVGANLKNDNPGMASWLSWTVVHQPTGGANLQEYGQGDFNLDAVDCPVGGSGDPSCGENLDILFVVNNAGSLGSGDQAVVDLLEADGHTVTLKSQGASASSHANGRDLVIISSTVSSSQVNTKFKNVTVPVLVWESYLFDDMKMTGTGAGTNYGSKGSRQWMDITDASHPMAAGLSGDVQVTTHNKSQTWGKVSADADVIARLDGSSSKATIFAYEAGDQMKGMAAPARRVGFHLDNYAASKWTNDGRALFLAAVDWAAGCN